jgi:hypothetical protein
VKEYKRFGLQKAPKKSNPNKTARVISKDSGKDADSHGATSKNPAKGNQMKKHSSMSSLNPRRGSKASMPNLVEPTAKKISITAKAGPTERISTRTKLNPGVKGYSSKLVGPEPQKPKNLVPETAAGPKDEKYSNQMHKRISIEYFFRKLKPQAS